MPKQNIEIFFEKFNVNNYKIILVVSRENALVIKLHVEKEYITLAMEYIFISIPELFR